MRILFLAFGMTLMMSQAFAAVPTCMINGKRRVLPSDVVTKDLSFHVSDSAGARVALLKSSGPTTAEVSSRADQLQIIGLYRSKNEKDDIHVHCFGQNAQQICTVNTEGTPHVVPGSFEVDGTKLDVSVQNGVRFIKIETSRALDISSTTGEEFSQRFSVLNQQRKLVVNCAGVKVKKAQTKYQQFAGCGPNGC